MTKTFLAVAAFGFTAAILAGAANAQQTIYPVCISGMGTQDCRYNSMQQCAQFQAGVGGDCIYNPAYANPSSAPPPNMFQRMMGAGQADDQTDQPNQPIMMPPPPRW
jgi:hypothetical protein